MSKIQIEARIPVVSIKNRKSEIPKVVPFGSRVLTPMFSRFPSTFLKRKFVPISIKKKLKIGVK